MQRSTLVRTLVICAIILSGWWLVSRQTTIASPAATFTAIVTAQPVSVKQSIKIEPGHAATWTFAPPANKVLGRFHGRWTCRGRTAGIAGAQDDNLVAFKLVGPNNRPIQQANHPINGNFDIRIDDSGAYTFEFDNSGIIRTSSRVVELNGTYQPD